jgi:hypothetical protein|tara:strand:- start:3338 stop:3655 length:318 start_codon:yes stop_codon:yes gene_type:complete
VEHPIFSVREELVPHAVVNLKVFEGDTTEEIESAINEWVKKTQNLVVCPGPLSVGMGRSSMAVTYVRANINGDPERKREVDNTPTLDAKPDVRRSGLESDGGRIA